MLGVLKKSLKASKISWLCISFLYFCACLYSFLLCETENIRVVIDKKGSINGWHGCTKIQIVSEVMSRQDYYHKIAYWTFSQKMHT